MSVSQLPVSPRAHILRTPTPIGPNEFECIISQIAHIERGLAVNFPRKLNPLVSMCQLPFALSPTTDEQGTVFMTVYRLVQLDCQQRGAIPISLVLPERICSVFTHALGWRTLALSYGGEVDVPVELVPTRSLERTIVLLYAQSHDSNQEH